MQTWLHEDDAGRSPRRPGLELPGHGDFVLGTFAQRQDQHTDRGPAPPPRRRNSAGTASSGTAPRGEELLEALFAASPQGEDSADSTAPRRRSIPEHLQKQQARFERDHVSSGSAAGAWDVSKNDLPSGWARAVSSNNPDPLAPPRSTDVAAQRERTASVSTAAAQEPAVKESQPRKGGVEQAEAEATSGDHLEQEDKLERVNSSEVGANLRGGSPVPTVLHIQRRRSPTSPTHLLRSKVPPTAMDTHQDYCPANHDAASGQAESRELYHEISRLQKQIQNLEEEAICQRTNQHNDQTVLRDKTKTLLQQVATSQADLKKIFNDFSATLDFHREHVFRKDSEIAELKKQIQDLKGTAASEIQKESNVREAMRKMIVTHEAEQVLLTELQDSYMDKLEGSIESLSGQMGAVSKAFTRCLSEAKASASSHAYQLRTSQTVHELRAELADFRGRHAELEEENMQMHEHVAMLAKAHAELQTACGQLEEEKLALRSQVENVQEQIRELQRLCKNSDQTLQELGRRSSADREGKLEEQLRKGSTPEHFLYTSDERRAACADCDGIDPERLLAEDGLYVDLNNLTELIASDLATCDVQIDRYRESRRRIEASLQEKDEEIGALTSECRLLQVMY